MLVILRENVENLGRVGDVVKVSDGYARNFLLPRRLVMAASDRNVEQMEHFKKTLEKKRLAQKAHADELAAKLSNYSCTLQRKVQANDKLFGSVTAADIADALKVAGYSVEKRAILLDEPLKTLGVHPVTIKLQPEVTTTVKVWIVKEEG